MIRPVTEIKLMINDEAVDSADVMPHKYHNCSVIMCIQTLPGQKKVPFQKGQIRDLQKVKIGKDRTKMSTLWKKCGQKKNNNYK